MATYLTYLGLDMKVFPFVRKRHGKDGTGRDGNHPVVGYVFGKLVARKRVCVCELGPPF